MMPLLLNRSVQAQFLIPMAISLSFGVLFSTLVTLLIVPATYLVLDDLKGLLKRRETAEARERLSAPAPSVDEAAAAGAQSRAVDL